LDKFQRRRAELEQEAARLDLAAAAEEKQAGTRVHLASLQAETEGPRNEGQWLRRKAAIAGTAGLALAVLLVGAFDPRLYDADDVRRAGGLSLGNLHVPRKRLQTSTGGST
jgi:ferric-dicitrate binding protein FerR (iron transport regulator)